MADRSRNGLPRLVTGFGVATTLAMLAAVVLSWVLAPFASFEGRTYAQYEFFARIGEAIPWIQGRNWDGLAPWRWGLQLAFRSRGLFENRLTFLLAYVAPLAVASLTTVTMLWLAWRRRAELQPTDADRALRWAVVFAVLCVPAVPVLVPDFWLSIAWGRTLAAGINPYYAVPAAATSWLPLDAPIMRETYGPLWTYLSGAIMWTTGNHALWGGLLFKLVLAAGWIGTLVLVRRLVRDRSPFEQLLAVAMVGWLPIGVIQTVGDGHNDVAMVVFALLWMALRRQGHRLAATAALTASVLFKYASAPLFLLDLLYRDPDESRSPARSARTYTAQAVVAALMTVIAFAPVFRGPDFFGSTTDVHGGHFYLPSDAIFAIGALMQVSLRPLAYLVLLIFPAVTAVALFRFWRDGAPRLPEASAAVMLTMLMVGSSHAWPWYVLWYLAFAATIPTSLLGRWAMALALTLPYPLLAWTIAPYASDLKKYFLPSLLAYGMALLWLLLVRWRRTSDSLTHQTTVDPSATVGRQPLPG